MDRKKFYITGIVLSAGLSGRMNAFKPLLKLNNGKTFIQTIVEKLSSVCDEIIVVTGYKNNEIEQSLISTEQKEKIKFVFNEAYKSGMFTSLQAGLSGTNSKWFLYHFVDQPSLPLSFYSDFANQIDDQFNWIQPTYQNRKGHPILFDSYVKEMILKESEYNTLRNISMVTSIKKKFWECNTELIFQDIDTQEDYRLTHSKKN